MQCSQCNAENCACDKDGKCNCSSTCSCAPKKGKKSTRETLDAMEEPAPRE
jgi:hypothetical protein